MTPDPASTSLKIRLLGRIEFWIGSHRIPLGRQRYAKYVLALLVTRYRGGVSRAELARTLWPHLDRKTAEDYLYKRLTRLYKQPNGLICRITGKGTQEPLRLVLRPGDWVDIDALRQQVAMIGDGAVTFAESDYRGQFLEELDRDELSAELREWLRQQRIEYEALFRELTAFQERPVTLSIPDDAALPSVSGVAPYSYGIPAPNLLFTGRAGLLREVGALLTQRVPVVLSGPPGIGKTEAAIACAHQHLSQGFPTFWIDGQGPETVRTGLAHMAGSIHPDLHGRAAEPRPLPLIGEWVKCHPECLIVVDNADEPSHVSEVLALGQSCRLLLTSRGALSPGVGTPLEVRELSDDDGAEFLLRRSGIIAPTQHRSDASPDDQAFGLWISREYQGHPLGLEQVGSLLQAGFTPAEFVGAYQTEGALLRARPSWGSLRGARSLHITMTLILRNLEQCAGAKEVLYLCASLASAPLPDAIIQAAIPTLSTGLPEPAPLMAAFSEVIRFGLLKRDRSTGMLSMHALIAQILLDTLTSDARAQWERTAVHVLGQAFPDRELDEWTLCEQLLPHAERCAAHIRRQSLRTRPAALLMDELGGYYHDRGRLHQARAFLEDTLRIEEEVYGPHSPQVGFGSNNLMVTCYWQGDYEAAERFGRQALSILARIHSQAHEDLGQPLANLAQVYRIRGDLDTAEALARQAVRNAAGLSHPDVRRSLDAMLTLFNIVREQGQDNEAEYLLSQQLALVEELTDPNDPLLARVLTARALLRLDTHQAHEAAADLVRVLRLERNVFGRRHATTAHTLVLLAAACGHLGRLRLAQRFAQRAVHIFQATLGFWHEQTAGALRELGDVQRARGAHEEARTSYERAYDIVRQVTPENQLLLSHTVLRLAYAFQDAGAHTEAAYWHRKSVELTTSELETDHPLRTEAVHAYERFLEELPEEHEM